MVTGKQKTKGKSGEDDLDKDKRQEALKREKRKKRQDYSFPKLLHLVRKWLFERLNRITAIHYFTHRSVFELGGSFVHFCQFSAWFWANRDFCKRALLPYWFMLRWRYISQIANIWKCLLLINNNSEKCCCAWERSITLLISNLDDSHRTVIVFILLLYRRTRSSLQETQTRDRLMWGKVVRETRRVVRGGDSAYDTPRMYLTTLLLPWIVLG